MEMLEDLFSTNCTLDYTHFHGGPIEWFALRNNVCKSMGVGKVLRDSIPRHLEKKEDMESFLKELMASSEPLRSMKLVVLGNGQIGKTTLLHAMKNILSPNSKQVIFLSL
jgi:hypothetical protein